MRSEPKNIPPLWATRLLEWYCKPELLEDLQGDLHEYFERNVESVGERRAKLIYVIDVLKFFRIYTVRRLEFVNLLINWIMLGSYIKTSGRNIIRNKLFSAINIVGLSISMSVGLLLIGVISDIKSYDQFHEKRSRIYRVLSHYEYLGPKEGNDMATTSVTVAKALQQDFSQPEAVAFFQNGFGGDLKFNEKAIPLSGYWANESVFKVFSFHLMKGNPATALKNPYSIVLTETSAKKLFGNDEALNKVVGLGKEQYTITGIVQDVPKFSHIRFDMLCSFSTFEILNKDDKDVLKWDNIWSTWVYLLLPENTDLANLKTNLDQLSAEYDPTVKNTHVGLTLQPLEKIMTGPDLNNSIGPVMGPSMLWIFGGLAFVVVLSACFNYTNLSIARSLRRTREVGIRKVVGALKRQVINQFVVEAVLISLCSLFVALLLFALLRPIFLSVENSLQEMLLLQLSPSVIAYFILFAIGVGVAAGFFPALFFSKVNASQALKDASSSIGFKKMTLRKVLIVFQYSISIIMITSTIIIYKQYKHFIAFDLGFKTENILNIKLQGNKAAILKKELSELPEVKDISQSILVTSIGNYWGAYMKYPLNPNDSSVIYYNIVDENYLPLHEHKLLAGKNFTAKLDSVNETEVIVCQSILKRFNIAGHDPQKAIGEIVKLDGKEVQIIGVLKDFHYGKADNKGESREIILRYSPKRSNWLNLKIESTDILTTYSKVESVWKKIDPIHPMDAKFYDDQIEKSFGGLKAAAKVAGFIAFLAISIASLGLLGMVVFTTETRLKEISIRKVLGASEAGLLYLLGRGFLILLLAAAIIALPITYLFFDQVVFQEIANHTSIAFVDLTVGFSFILLLALVMITLQTFKATRTNPAQVLKSE
ncbi:MAG TPA: ABC transporter permease [Cyclobacteriaceae bacterium]|jgi:ABC-type antimicrobial peptide transport system permease subunit|nr:ABC transporter permease [Cyclobacteriaceae bacterium]